MRDDIIERQGQRIEVMLLGARSWATNSGGFRGFRRAPQLPGAVLRGASGERAGGGMAAQW